MPSDRSPGALVALLLLPVVVLGALLVFAATTGAFFSARTIPPLLALVSLAVPLVGLYLLARIAGELGRIADAMEADSVGHADDGGLEADSVGHADDGGLEADGDSTPREE